MREPNLKLSSVLSSRSVGQVLVRNYICAWPLAGQCFFGYPWRESCQDSDSGGGRFAAYLPGPSDVVTVLGLLLCLDQDVHSGCRKGTSLRSKHIEVEAFSAETATSGGLSFHGM